MLIVIVQRVKGRRYTRKPHSYEHFDWNKTLLI